MSDTNTQTPTPDAAPDLKALTTERDQLAARVKDLEAQAGSAKELEGKLAGMIVERDGLATKFKDYDAIKAERDQYAAKVDGYVKREREAAIVTHMRAAAPGADGFALEAALVKLAESGEIDRHSEKAQETAAKAIELLKARAPGLLTAPALGGGGSHAPQQHTPSKNKSLI